jgi:hypothetical protein
MIDSTRLTACVFCFLTFRMDLKLTLCELHARIFLGNFLAPQHNKFTNRDARTAKSALIGWRGAAILFAC